MTDNMDNSPTSLNVKTVLVNNRELCYFRSLDSELNETAEKKHYYLNHFQSLIASGAKATSFLQGQLTINVETQTSTLLGAYCNIKGRIIGLFYCTKLSEERFQLFMPKDIIESVYKKLSIYSKFSKVELSISNAHVFAHQSGDSLSFDLVSSDEVATYLQEKNYPLLGSLAFHYHQLLQNIPTIYTTTQDNFLPHKIGLDKLQAIDVKKGCYLGQEIIARMHFKGKLKTFVTSFTATESIEPGQPITFQQKTIGEVIDSSITPDGKFLILASILLSEKDSDFFA